MKQVLVLEARIEGYSIGQCKHTMTVGQLQALIEDYGLDDDTEIYLSHDDGYTFGSIQMSDFDTREVGDDELE